VRFVATLVVLVSTTTASAECQRAAVPAGDPELVRSLIDRLTASGIATTATSGCPAVTVHVEQRGQQLHLELADAFHRTGARDVQDLATAAAIVESWTLQEVEARAIPEESIAVVPPLPMPVVHHVVRSGVAASVTSGVGSNGGTTWIGGSISACIRIGPLCTGAMVRAETDTGLTAETADQDSYAASAWGTIDLPQPLGGFVISPGLGVGYGYLHVVTHHHDAMNNPLDIPTADHTLRTAARFALLYSISERLAVFGDLWGDLAIERSNSQFGPAGSLQLSLGLRFEAP
jgi:hypothetical protein